MKQHLYVLAILALAFNACGPVYVVQQPAPRPPAPAPLPPPPPEQQPEASYQSFYDDLSPYGQWIDDPNYGYVWLPDVGPDFKPYATNGHWVYTDEGWTWASDYQWGWATFHYGRWFFEDGYGWMWVPGNEYSPAWVTWRNSDDYYGWAPMGPGVSFDMAYGGGYAPPSHYWCFVPHQYVSSPQIRNYYVNESRNVVIINHTTVINNITIVNNNVHTRNVNYGHGPDPNEVGRYTGNSIRPVPVRPSTRPVPGGQANDGGLAVYRPRINDAPRSNNGNMGVPPRFAPTRVSNLNNARPQNTAVYGSRPANTGYPNRDNNPVNNRPASGFDRPATPGGQPQGQQPQGRPEQGQPQGQAQIQPQRPFQPQGRPELGQPQGRPDQGQPQSQPVQPQGQPVQQPANPPSGQPFSRPANTGNPSRDNNAPVNNRPSSGFQPQQPAGQPMTRTFIPPARPATQQPALQQPTNQPVNRPINNRPTFIPRPQTTPSQTPAVQPKPVTRQVPPPPPPPKKDDDKKDTRPVKQQ